MGIKLQNVSLIRNPKTPWEVHALRNIHLSVDDGEAIGLMGPSGAGKSTLLQIISSLIAPTAGMITNTKGQSVGMVFQEPQRGFFASSVWEEVEYGPENLGLSSDIIHQRTIDALKSVELPESLWQASPFHLSGGQQRRVAIASVLSMEPSILLLDEPSIGLDWRGETALLQLLQKLRVERNITLIVGSHDPDLLFRICSRVIVLDQGTIVADGLWCEWFLLQKEFKKLNIAGPTALEAWTSLVDRGFPSGKAPANELEALAIFRQWKGDRTAWPSSI